jgi:hypothetical protein
MRKLHSILTLSLCAVLASLAVAAAAEEKEAVIKVNPIGEPKSLGEGDGIRYFLWYDAAGWHLRTDSGGRKHDFTGLIKVVGGKVTRIANFGNLETGKKKKKADLGILSKGKDEITFKFTTSKRHDGFDFQVDDAATSIKFQLMIEGGVKPGRVLIGAAGQPASDEVFSLPAHPAE